RGASHRTLRRGLILWGHGSTRLGMRGVRARRTRAIRGGRRDLPANPDPVVAEDDVPTRVHPNPRHVTIDAALPGRDRAGRAPDGRTGRRPGGTAMAFQAGRVIGRAVRGGPRVRIVAGHAIERPRAPAVARRLQEPDRLESGQVRIVGPDLFRARP